MKTRARVTRHEDDIVRSFDTLEISVIGTPPIKAGNARLVTVNHAHREMLIIPYVHRRNRCTPYIDLIKATAFLDRTSHSYLRPTQTDASARLFWKWAVNHQTQEAVGLSPRFWGFFAVPLVIPQFLLSLLSNRLRPRRVWLHINLFGDELALWL